MYKTDFINKNVLVTGRTGFKGSWLFAWLSMPGENVISLSGRIPAKLSHYKLIKDCFWKDLRFDIRGLSKYQDVLSNLKPDYIFHLAAQPIVLLSYKSPLDTINTNIIGIANILEAMRNFTHDCITVMITSDK